MSALIGSQERHKDDRRKLEVVTPEGIPIEFRIARLGDRAAAFFLDMLIIFGVLLAISLLIELGGFQTSGWLWPFLLLIAFFLRNFYLMFFEIRWQGSSPGKRAVKIRVIGRGGTPLTADAVIARNLMRELEIWVPAALLFAPHIIYPDAPGWLRAVAAVWVLVIGLFPAFNRDRLRPGDIVGGTVVVMAPEALLLSDIGSSASATVGIAPKAKFTFTSEQLKVYGIYELQILEDVLRAEPGQVGRQTAMDQVCVKIARKIGWKQRIATRDVEPFLRDFYTALRAHLERDMLFGKRREDKYSK